MGGPKKIRRGRKKRKTKTRKKIKMGKKVISYFILFRIVILLII
jgi:hypothetical protein